MRTKTTLSIIIILYFNLFYVRSGAQPLNWQWDKATGSVGNDFAKAIANDPYGNVYTTGYFEGTVDFNPGSDTFNLTSAGSQDGFILKLDGSGNFLWAKAISGPSNESGASIALDSSGNIYLTGNFSGTTDFDPDSSVTFNLTSNGANDIFIVKYNTNGNLVWAKAIGGTGSDAGQSVTMDPAGNGDIYTTGSYSGTVDFDPGAGTVNLSSGSHLNIFILKLDNSGNFILAKGMVGISGDAYALSITVDTPGNIYTTGYFSDTVNFDPGQAVNYNLISAQNSPDIFISKLDSLGNFEWAKQIGGGNFDKGFSIAVDPTTGTDICLTGYFRGTVDFNPGPATFNLISYPGSNTIFVMKINSFGNLVWAKQMGGPSPGSGYALAFDKSGSGSVYTTGFFDGTVDFDPDSGVYNLSANVSSDVFISKLNSSGNFVWAQKLGGVGFDIGNSISLTTENNVHITGSFKSDTIQLPGIPDLINADTSGITWDSFIAKFSCSTLSYITANSCLSYTSPSGNNTWFTSGIYQDFLTNSIGCDSIITVNLTITNFSDSVIQSGITLSALDSGVHYQWLDCDNLFAPLIGDSNRLFTATANGNYAVVISQNDCTDTSACYSVTGVGINEIHSQHNFELFPNPAREQFIIVLNDFHKPADITIRDMAEKEIYVITVIGKRSIEINTKNFAEGIYAVKVKRDDFLETKKLIITN